MVSVKCYILKIIRRLSEIPEEKEVHMTVEQRKESWKREEEIAHIYGWDFSHIHGRYTEEDDLPWDFGKIVQKYRNDSMKLMDM